MVEGKRKYQPLISTNQPLISTNQPLITQKSTIDYDKSITRDFNRESTREIAFTFSEEFPLEDNESFGSEFPPEVGNSSPAPLGLFQNNSFDSTENKEINPLPSVYEIKVPGQSSSEVCREAVPIVDKTNPELLPETDFQKAFLNLFGIEFFPLSIYKETIQKLEKSLPSHSLKKILTLPFYEIGQAVYELDKFIGLNPEYFS